MFLHHNLRNVKCLKVSDAGSASEFYWTWQIFTEKNSQTLLAQGFSLGCPIDDGYSLTVGQQRELNDPKFTIEFPEIKEGESNKIALNLYCWESDHSSEEVKKAFTNSSVETLWKIYENQKQNKKKTQEEFLEWFKDSDNDFLNILTASSPSVAGYLAISRAAIPLIKGPLN